MTTDEKIRPKERDAILQSLRAGVVPRIGQQHIQVGRVREVETLVKDIERVADAGSAIRFVIGEYGAGKTFFLYLIRSVALQMKAVTAHADLSPDRRLQATGGQARGLYAELMRNMATRTKPEGNALPSVVERFVTSALSEGRAQGKSPATIITERLQHLAEMVGGYDFAEVIGAYWRGHDTGNDQLKTDAVRWLRGEFTTKTDARAALGVRSYVDDGAFYDQLKLMARFVRLAGYSGLIICLDEMVNIYKLTSTQARNANYEQILRILNDCLQGSGGGLGFLLSGTPEFVTDTRRGLYSYQALQSRLAENTFAVDGLVDLSGPLVRLANLTPEDVFVLLGKLRRVYAALEGARAVLPDDGIQAFMAHCAKRVGDAYFRTPRNTIRAFLDLLAVLEQNPSVRWEDLLGKVEIEREQAGSDAPEPDGATNGDDELSTFRI